MWTVIDIIDLHSLYKIKIAMQPRRTTKKVVGGEHDEGDVPSVNTGQETPFEELSNELVDAGTPPAAVKPSQFLRLDQGSKDDEVPSHLNAFDNAQL